jgi:Aromatic-ring hydroxylase, C-terminal
LIAEVEMVEEPEWGVHRDAFGVHSFGRVEYEIRDGGEVVYMHRGPVRVMVTEQHVGPGTEPTLRIHYDLGEGHPLLGRRMPDLDLVSANGSLRVFTLLHDARPVLLNLGEPGGFDITPWADRVQFADARYFGVWELPILGAVTAPPPC